jgi:hypothetical protein
MVMGSGVGAGGHPLLPQLDTPLLAKAKDARERKQAKAAFEESADGMTLKNCESGALSLRRKSGPHLYFNSETGRSATDAGPVFRGSVQPRIDKKSAPRCSLRKRK